MKTIAASDQSHTKRAASSLVSEAAPPCHGLRTAAGRSISPYLSLFLLRTGCFAAHQNLQGFANRSLSFRLSIFLHHTESLSPATGSEPPRGVRSLHIYRYFFFAPDALLRIKISKASQVVRFLSACRYFSTVPDAFLLLRAPNLRGAFDLSTFIVISSSHRRLCCAPNSPRLCKSSDFFPLIDISPSHRKSFSCHGLRTSAGRSIFFLFITWQF